MTSPGRRSQGGQTQTQVDPAISTGEFYSAFRTGTGGARRVSPWLALTPRPSPGLTESQLVQRCSAAWAPSQGGSDRIGWDDRASPSL